jgi:hypothetical protein
MHVPIVRMTVRTMVMMAVIVVLMIMMIMAAAIVMFVACVGVELIRRSDGGADRSRPMHRPQRREESPSFDP